MRVILGTDKCHGCSITKELSRVMILHFLRSIRQAEPAAWCRLDVPVSPASQAAGPDDEGQAK